MPKIIRLAKDNFKVGDIVKAHKGIIKGNKFLICSIDKTEKGIDYIDAVDLKGKLRIYYPKYAFRKCSK